MTVCKACEKIHAARKELDRLEYANENGCNDIMIDILTDYIHMLNNMQVVCKGV